MKRRALGNHGLIVSAIGLGCAELSGLYGPASDEEGLAIIAHAIDLDVTLLDTGDSYGAGHNESLIGRAVSGLRDRVVLATKFGPVLDHQGAIIGVNGRPEFVIEACERSLKSLGVETIDLYFLHRIDPSVPIEETVGAMARLVESGKVRFLGLSEAGPATIRRAHVVHPISALQTEYSLWWRRPEEELLPLCRELGIGYVAYAPLGRGLLAGEIRDQHQLGEGDSRREHPRFKETNLTLNLERVGRVGRLAHRVGCNAAQLCLAWLLSKGSDIIPIPGTKRFEHLEANVDAVDIELTLSDIAELEAIFPIGAGAGLRYPGSALQRLDDVEAARTGRTSDERLT